MAFKFRVPTLHCNLPKVPVFKMLLPKITGRRPSEYCRLRSRACKATRSKSHSESLMMHYARSSQPVNIKGTSCPHDQFQPANPSREHSADLPSPEDRIMDPLERCATPDVTALSAVSPTLQTKSPQLSASESVYQRSHREPLLLTSKPFYFPIYCHSQPNNLK